ncbi:hypothetical protein R75483_07206 [Paraburkholderia domus]|nr:hypothetical protein R75483_07206 [Paraburkholderia domus]
MQVDSSSSRQNVTAPVAMEQSGVQSTQSTQAPVQPAVYDTSGAGNTQQSDSGSAGPVPVQNGLPPPGFNVGTEWKLGPDGEHQYVGYFPAPNPHPGNQQGETQWDVFKRGVTDGATHPGQTIGKIVDMSKKDGSHSGEEAGKKVDNTLEKLPVVGDALGITRGVAGQKNPDGSPVVPSAPNAQPDASESVSPRSGGKAPGTPASEAPSMTKPGEQPAPSKTLPVVSNGASRTSETIRPTTAEPQATAPKEGKRGTNTPSTSEAHFDVPAQYAAKPSGNLQADRNSPGIFRDDKGQAYIQAADKNWAVQYDKANGTWRAYSPDDGSKVQYPVRLDEQGNWQVHNDVGLKGGNPGDTAAGGSNLSNRDRLNTEVQKSPTGNEPGSYPGSVNIVNNLLQRLGINLSDQSADSIINSVRQVDAGELAHAAASAREVWTFARDVADPNLSMRDRSAAALGMVLNGIAAPAAMAQFDLENYHFGRNQSADLRRATQMFMQFDPHA